MAFTSANRATGDGAARQEFLIRKPASNSQPISEKQDLVIGAGINNNGCRCGKPIASYRRRLIGTLGFPRRGRRNPFSATVFGIVRRELGVVAP